jgi:hypothetical protein
MCPNTPTTSPNTSTAVNAPRWDEATSRRSTSGEPYI